MKQIKTFYPLSDKEKKLLLENSGMKSAPPPEINHVTKKMETPPEINHIHSIADGELFISSMDLSKTPVFIYNGTEQKPFVSVKDESGRLLTDNEYDVIYVSNKNAGTATVTVVGKNGFVK